MKRVFTSILVIAAIAIFAQCKKKEDCKEVLKPNCACQEIYDPVCGCNNKTYSNACEAECYGITTYRKGACQ